MLIFQPPADDRFPWADYRSHTPDHELFGYVRQGVRAKNLYYLVNGSFTDVDPLDPSLVRKVYYGGHRYEVDADEAAVLTAAGFGANITEE